MKLSTYLTQFTGLTAAQLFGEPGGAAALVAVVSDASGNLSIKSWNVPNVTAPTSQQIATALAAPEPANPTALASYANAKQWALATGGVHVAIEGTTYLFATDPTSMTLVTAAYMNFLQSGAPTSITWQLASGFVTISAADFIAAAKAIFAAVQSTFTALQPVLEAITAGSITTTAQIDAASWPTL